MKKLIITTLIFTTIILTLITQFNLKPKYTQKKYANTAAMSIGTKENPNARIEWEQKRLADSTGTIPAGIRGRELQFAQNLRNKLNAKTQQEDTLNWISRGPYNAGGRTRAIAFDVADEKTIIAGSVSGGVFKTINGGQSWTKKTTADQNNAVTCLVQDTRPGKTNIWYYGTGEGYGASASDGGAFYLGNGLYKSTDNGETWKPLNATNSNTPNTFDNRWDIVWNIATDPSTDTADIVYAATYGVVNRSVNGGLTWTKKLGNTTTESYTSNVIVTPTGVVYATLSSDGTQNGIFRSGNKGATFQEITPPDFPADFERIVMDYAPTNPNIVYFLAVTPNDGKETYNYIFEPEKNSLWKYEYLSGNGTGNEGVWTNLSDNIPIGPNRFDDFNVQGGYNLLVKVKPDDINTIFIGGTNLFRSTDGFTTSDNIQFIGGYAEDTDLPLFHSYENHHPDQHNLIFLPSNPNVIISANDGGLWKSNNCMDNTVVWEKLNNGYLTTQFYTIACKQDAASPILIGGLQDNGTYFTNTSNPMATWVMTFNYDGAFCAIPKYEDYYIMSTQECKMVKLKVDEETGKFTEFTRIDPQGASDYLFINPFTLDPVDNNILYLAEGTKFWVNTNLKDVPLISGFDSIATNWIRNVDTIKAANTKITAIAASTNGSVYLGTDKKKVYRADNAATGNAQLVDITGVFPSTGYVTCIATHYYYPERVFVLFSNYGVYSMFYSKNSGETWTKVAGNLEANINGTGNGPSLRWLSILPLNPQNPDSTSYFLGTSVGLFYTTKIDSVNTTWLPTATETIGSTVVEMVETREIDKMVVAATHGNGVFSANAPAVGIKPVNNSSKITAKVFPNIISVNTNAYLNLSTPSTTKVQVLLYSQNGVLVQTLVNNLSLDKGTHATLLNTKNLLPGVYIVAIKSLNEHISLKILVQ